MSLCEPAVRASSKPHQVTLAQVRGATLDLIRGTGTLDAGGEMRSQLVVPALHGQRWLYVVAANHVDQTSQHQPQLVVDAHG